MPGHKLRTRPELRPKNLSSQHEDKLGIILSEAARQFSERGYQNTSLEEIAEGVNIHKATIYHYFRSKEEILYLCLTRAMDNHELVLQRLGDSTVSPLARLEAFLTVLIQAQTTAFGRCMSLVGLSPLGENTGEDIRTFQRRLEHAVRKVVTEGIKEGSIRQLPPRLVSAMIFGAYNWVPRWYFGRTNDLSPEEISRIFFDIFLKGLEPR